MRDINRIDPFIENFKTLWKKYPDLRFGQLVEIIYRQTNNIELFSIEDDKMLNQILKMQNSI